jgi:AAT family amino acid transporter
MFMMMRAVGEMLYQDPTQHTFINFITKYIGPAAGYFAGWSYWISLIFVGMAEITAVAHYVQFWFPDWPSWSIQIGFLIVLAMINLIAVRIFGEAEFWFAMIKIVAILALIVTGIMMVATGFKAPNGQTASIANLTSHFSLFPNGVFNFMIAFQMVFFAFQGMEFIGITTSETKNPRKVLPKAINQMTIRILIFYIGALAVIMMIYNWRSLDPNQSPFVQVFELAGINWAAALVNFVVLTSASSALNAALYSTGRHLYQLGKETDNRFMKNFSSLSENGVPTAAILFSAGMILLSPVISSIPAISNAFSFVTSASSSVYIVIYILTMVAHWRYRKSQDFMPDGFLMPAYKIMSPLVILFFVYVFVALFMQQSTVFAAVGGIIWVIIFGSLSRRKFSRLNR